MKPLRFLGLLCLFLLLSLFSPFSAKSEEKYTPNQCKQGLTQYLEKYFKNSQENNAYGIPIKPPYEFSIIMDKKNPLTMHVLFKAIPHAYLVGYDPRKEYPLSPNEPLIKNPTEPFITPKVKKILEETPFEDIGSITCSSSSKEWKEKLRLLNKKIEFWYGDHQNTEFIRIFDERFDVYFIPIRKDFNLRRKNNVSPIPIYLPSWEYYIDDDYDILKIEVFAHAFRCEKNNAVCEDEKNLLKSDVFPKEFWLKKQVFSFKINTKNRKPADLEKELDARAAELAKEIAQYYIENTADFI